MEIRYLYKDDNKYLAADTDSYGENIIKSHIHSEFINPQRVGTESQPSRARGTPPI